MPWTHVHGKAVLSSYLLLLLTADPLLGSVPDGFEVAAVIRSTYHPEQGEPSIMEYTFEITVHGCESRIRAAGIPDPGVEFFEYGTYETGSYFLAQYRPATGPSTSVNEASLHLYPGIVPVRPTALIPLVWAAYASACYYASNTTGLVDPVSFVAFGFRAKGRKLPAAWQLSRDPPHLLESLVELCDGYVYTDRENGALDIERLPNKLQPGQTNLVFQSIVWTNLGSITVPLQFRAIRSAPDHARLTRRVVQVMDGKTLSLSPRTSGPLAPLDPSPMTMVYDHRLQWDGKKLPPITYLADGGIIKKESEVMALDDYEHAVAAERIKARGTTLGGRLIMFLLVAIAAAPILVFLVSRRSKRTT